MTALVYSSLQSAVMFIPISLVVSLLLAHETTAASGNVTKDVQQRSRRQTSERLCPPLLSLNMIVTCVLRNKEVSCNTDMRPGTVAKPKCKRFYKPSIKPTYSRLTCLNDGKWDNTLFYCTPECGSSNLNSNIIRIIDGIESGLGAFPWHAGLYFRDTTDGTDTWIQRCSGSLITDQFVITAAHCVSDTVARDLRVALGKYYRSWDVREKGDARITVSKIIYQSDFSKKLLTFDIAILRLNEKVVFSDTIMPVCRGFPDDSTHLKINNLYVVGWGLTEEGNVRSSSNTLLYNTVTVVNDDVCRKNGPSVYPTFDKFCAVKSDRPDVSIVQRGDSGGGITSVYDGLHVILGTVSAKDKQYSIFTNFTWPYNVIWIESQIRKYDASFRWDENVIMEFQNSDRGCLLPEASSSRKFCSLADGCEDCDIYDRLCFIPPGSKVERVRVVCAPGYTLRSPYNGGDVAICRNGRSWYPEIPDCHRYQYVPGNPMGKVTWQEARDHCTNKGHQLATIKNEGEQESFKEAVAEYFNAKGGKGNAIWIGLSDLKYNKTFEWVDGSILSESDFSSWRPGEPSEGGANRYPDKYLEHCVEAFYAEAGCGGSMRKNCVLWNDQYCTNLNFYFCKETVPSDAHLDKISDLGYETLKVQSRYVYLPGNPWIKATWSEARENCLAKGSQLAIIRAADQQKLFEEAVKKHFKDTDTTPSSVWIGLKYITVKGSRIFDWVDGSVYNQHRQNTWNNWIKKPSGSWWKSDCIEAAAGDTLKLWTNATLYQWNDVSCEKNNYYFCSIKLI